MHFDVFTNCYNLERPLSKGDREDSRAEINVTNKVLVRKHNFKIIFLFAYELK